jgi:hypothetical protein
LWSAAADKKLEKILGSGSAAVYIATRERQPGWRDNGRQISFLDSLREK